jgi:hypothetical protein
MPVKKSAKGLAAPGVTSMPIREQLDNLRRPYVSPLISSVSSINNLMRNRPSANEIRTTATSVSPNRHDYSHIPRDSVSPSIQVNLHTRTTPRNLNIPRDSESRAISSSSTISSQIKAPSSSGNQGITNRTL